MKNDRAISLKAALDAADSIIERDMSGNNDVVKAMTAWKEYINALPSAQPECEDAVSRKAVAGIYTALWEIIGTIMDRDEWDDVCHTTANELPSVTPKQPGWIPCTPETMPKMTDTYLVQVGINENGEGMHTEVRTAVWNVVWHKWYVHTTRCFVGDIIKWMPIPWKGERDES